ncbi:MAG: 6-phosphogluconolactonase, partial [Clostridia bacterium]
AAQVIRDVYAKKGEANVIFASSPSQLNLFDALIKEEIDWGKVNVFHMDEYIGISTEEPASFGNYVREHLLKYLSPKCVYYLNGLARDIYAECDRYARLLTDHPVDVTFAGIGENGHMAFNDPYIADFFDPKLVKINECLDDACRCQQVNDHWFTSIDQVPEKALTLTFPALLRAPFLIITVPGFSKRKIIKEVLEGPIGLDVPSTCARLHRNAVLFIDDASAQLLDV